MAGLVLATGLIGIPHWPSIDRFVPVMLLLCGLGMVAVGVGAVWTRLHRGRFPATVMFWHNLNFFYCKLIHRVKRDGLCTIPGEGPVIVAANHVSGVDPLLLLATSPNRYISFLIAREYYETPIAGRIIKLAECIPVNRTGNDTASIKVSLRHLSDGKLMGIFPQGGIRPVDDASEVRGGIGMLALRSGATVIPAYVSGVPHTDSVVAALFTRHHAVVRYGPPVDLSAFAGREKDKNVYAEASNAIMNAIRALKRPEDA
jgi:1-acyl-sn-glycerol-3-phosphate acyltransferase